MTAAERAEGPFGTSAGCVLEMNMDDAIDDRLQVRHRIDAVVVKDRIAGVIVDAHRVVVNCVKKPTGHCSGAGHALVDLKRETYAVRLRVVTQEASQVAELA